MDAILALGVTDLVDHLTAGRADLTALGLDRRRDLLLLAALYDQSTGESIERRWSRLRRRSGFRPLWSRRDLQIGVGTTLLVALLLFAIPACAPGASRPTCCWSCWPAGSTGAGGWPAPSGTRPTSARACAS
jgi:hypothetical protein